MRSQLHEMLNRLRGFVRKQPLDREFDAEMKAHLDLAIEENLRLGLSSEEATRQALVSFGGIEQAKEQHRDARGLPMLDVLMQDLRYSVRVLAKSRGFTAVALLTLALGIGANSAIFSVIDAVLLNRLPYPESSRLVVLWEQNPGRGWYHNIVSAANFVDWRRQNHVFSRMSAIDEHTYDVSGSGEPLEVEGERVSANFFNLLGVRPALGRTFVQDEDSPGSARVVVLSDGLWKRRYGGDPGILGREITIDGEHSTVIGIMRQGFYFPAPSGDKPELWLAGLDLRNPARTWHGYDAIARLKSGVSVERAQAEMDTIASGLEKQYPEQKGWNVQVISLHENIVGNTRPALLILLAAVGVVLLIACANLEALQLARVSSREKEMAIRGALGAGRGRVIRQLVTESVLLAVAGGGLGLLVASWGTRFLVALAPEDTPGLGSVHVNAGVLGFTLILSLLTGIIAGIVPALTASRIDINNSLKESERGSSGSARTRSRLGLLASWELALAVVLLAGAGLLIKTFVALTHVDMGIDPHKVLTMRVALSGPQYAKRASQVEFLRELLNKVEALPGVTSAAVIDGGGLPPDGGNGFDYLIVGRPTPPPSEYPDAVNRVISADYFRTMGIQLLRGRLFTEADDANAARVVVINERMAREYWPGADPIGSQLTFPNVENLTMPDGRKKAATRFTIVGVVKNVKNRGLEVQPDEEVYVPYTQEDFVPRTLLVKSSVKPASLVSAIRSQVQSLDPAQPIADVATLDEIVTQARAGSRFPMTLLALFAGLALILAAVGVYGVMSYSVGQRVHEIGIRIALGAERRDVFSLVVGQGAKLAAIGLGMGLAAALSLTWLMSKLLFGVRPQDPLTFVAVTLILIAVVVFATYVPARRAVRVDPIVALRDQ